ncbi:MAG: helix-turn-helix transcriptional regulator [Anaerolineae bacterium]|nr:helix-turn-helix transcriptional regulator [Anaerolineae bacterium]
MHNRGKHCGGHGCSRRMGQFLDPVLLLLLKEVPTHGYTLLGRMADFGLDFLNPTVIYRALREMEENGWVTSTWNEDETQGPPRRVYALTPFGEEVLECCTQQIRAIQGIIQHFLEMSATLPSGTKQSHIINESQ